MKILTVDDNPMTGILLANMITELGHEPLVAQDATTAIGLVDEHAPQIIILDWMMPTTNGLELACAIRRHASTVASYIIMLSAKDATGCLSKAYKLGISEFIRKPVVEGELEARLQAAVRFIQMRDGLLQARNELRDKSGEIAALTAELERWKQVA